MSIVIAVEGIIGAGKTTLIDILRTTLIAKGWRVVVVKEPVDKWVKCGILDLFYKDPGRWGYHFQTKAFHDRIVENIEAHAAHWDSADIFILERSPFTDSIFMEVLKEEGHITDLEMDHYKEWWKLWFKVMPYEIDLFVYLKPDVDVCMARLRERSRDEEGGVTHDYQERLGKAHDRFFSTDVKIAEARSVPCMIMNTNDNFRDDDTLKKKYSDQIEKIVIALQSLKK